MKEYLQQRIRDYVEDIKDIYNSISDEESESAEKVSGVIWEKGRSADVAYAAIDCGALTVLFEIAHAYNIKLDPEVAELEKWALTISPAG